MCKQCGLDQSDLDLMTIGMCLDYVEEYVEYNNPNSEKSREAQQRDMDLF